MKVKAIDLNQLITNLKNNLNHLLQKNKGDYYSRTTLTKYSRLSDSSQSIISKYYWKWFKI